MVKDPVCGVTIDEKKASGKVDYQGKYYFFCSLSCHEAFESNPTMYLDRNIKKSGQ